MSSITQFWKVRKAEATAPKVVVGGFGKHPKWAEHEQKLGELSETLTELRKHLYWDGILKLLPEWKALPQESRCEFNHWLVWVQPGSVVLGRIVASTDLAGRDAVPFIVLLEVKAYPLVLTLRRLVERLDEFTQRCLGLPSPEVVRAAFTSQAGALESLILGSPTGPEAQSLSAEEREAYFAAQGLDAEGMALARLLYKVELSWSPYQPLRGGKAPKFETGVALRLPGASGHLLSSVLLWEEFVTARVHPDVPRMYIVPAAHSWLDLVVGKVEGGHFFGLQAGRNRLGTETEVPHAITPELQARAKAIIAAWHHGTSLQAVEIKKPESSSQEPEKPAHSEPDKELTPKLATASRKEVRGQPKLLGGLLAVLLLAAASWLYMGPGRSGFFASDKVSLIKPRDNSSNVPPVSAGPEIASVKDVPVLDVGGKEQTLSLSLRGLGVNGSVAKWKFEATAAPAGRLTVRTNYAGGQWQLVLSPQAEGTATVSVIATDERGARTSVRSFGMMVNPKPEAPVVNPLEAQELEVGQTAKSTVLGLTVDLRLQLGKIVMAVKADKAGVVSASTKFAGGRWQLILEPRAAGNTTISVVAMDERGLKSQEVSFPVTVSPKPEAPVVHPLGAQELEVGQTAKSVALGLTVDRRLELEKMVMEVKADKAGVVSASTNFVGGHWQLILEPRSVGNTTVSVVATDERGSKSQLVSFPVTVNPKLEAPVVAKSGAQELLLGQTARNMPLSLTVDRRLQLEKVLVEVKADKAGIVSVSTNFAGEQWQLILEPRSVGNTIVSVAATDERGSKSQVVNFPVTVNPKLDAPVVAKPGAQELELGQTPKNMPLGLTVGQGLQLEKLLVEVKIDKPDVASVRTNFADAHWQLVLEPRGTGNTVVSVVATDERGSKSPTVSFPVTVNPKPEAPVLAKPDAQELELGQTPKNMPLGLTVDQGLQLEKLLVEVKVDKPDVTSVRTNFAGGHWQLVLEARGAGNTAVSVVATDERGSKSPMVSFHVTVNPKLEAPALATVGNQALELGQAATNVVLGLKLDRRLQVEKVLVVAKADNTAVVRVVTNLTQGRWQLVLFPLAAGTAKVGVTATDEKGAKSPEVKFGVSVNLKPEVPLLARAMDQVLEVGQAEMNVTLALTVDQRLRLEKTALEAKAEDGRVVGVTTKFDGVQWQLALIPRVAGSSKVNVSATDEQGSRSAVMSFLVSVNPKPAAPSVGQLAALMLQVGQPATNVLLGVKVTSPLALDKVVLEAKATGTGVLNVTPRFSGGQWWLVMEPKGAGTATVSVIATDERGQPSLPMSFGVTVAGAHSAEQAVQRNDLPAASSTELRGASEQEAIRNLDLQLAAFKIWFDLPRKSDSQIKNPPHYPDEGQVARFLGGDLSIPRRKFYRQKAAELKKNYQAIKPLSPELEKTFKQLSERIDYWR